MELPYWARWGADPRAPAWTVGIEEEVMLLEPGAWTLAQAAEEVLAALSPALAASMSGETHAGALELATGPHRLVADAAGELGAVRAALAGELRPLGLRVAAAGTHPLADGHDTQVSEGARYEVVHESMRGLARREPTFALHVHVGIADPETASDVADRLRAHLPLLLALSAASPFWRGRDSGMASFRTPLFGAFPRTGIPRRFGAYRAWVAAVDALVASDAVPEPTFVWWDVRLQPRFGTVEVRVMDSQPLLGDTAALAALVQALARLEAEERHTTAAWLDAPEILDENRFLAARDGIAARFIDPRTGARVAARALLDELLTAARPHAEDLGASGELDRIEELADAPPAAWQRAVAARGGGPGAVLPALADAFSPAGLAAGAAEPAAS